MQGLCTSIWTLIKTLAERTHEGGGVALRVLARNMQTRGVGWRAKQRPRAAGGEGEHLLRRRPEKEFHCTFYLIWLDKSAFGGGSISFFIVIFFACFFVLFW